MDCAPWSYSVCDTRNFITVSRKPVIRTYPEPHGSSHRFVPYFAEIHIIFPCTAKSLSGLLSPAFPTIILHASYLPVCPTCPLILFPWFHHLNNMLVEEYKLRRPLYVIFSIIMFLVSLCSFISHMSEYSSQPFVLRHSRSVFFH